MKTLCVCVLLAFAAGCGNGEENGNGDITEVIAYMGLGEGKTWSYDVEFQAAVLDGEVTVVGIDQEYVDGVDAYKVELRQNQLLVATRWYQVKLEGLFLLGEEVAEQSTVVERTFLTPLKMLPYPLESDTGVPVQSWTTDSDLEQGGSETHRFDNGGKQTIEVPAGSFTAFRLVHTRNVTGGDSFAFDEYFSPQNWYPQFEFPEESVWKLK
jgi:hypothetical protein